MLTFMKKCQPLVTGLKTTAKQDHTHTSRRSACNADLHDKYLKHGLQLHNKHLKHGLPLHKKSLKHGLHLHRYLKHGLQLHNKYLKHGLQNGNMACHGGHMQRGGASRSRHI